MKKKNPYLRTEQELWDDVKYKCNCNPTMYEGHETKETFEEIMSNTFPKLMN